MRTYFKKKLSALLLLGVLGGLILASPKTVSADSGQTRIHFIGLQAYTDCILLESNGHYGLIDSGEDWDYPDDNDPLYPFREGTSTNSGFEAQVIHYLDSMGITDLDFYIGTHSHSDHIGSGNEILDHFNVKTLYLGSYNDFDIVDWDKWDNLFVYDDLMKSARKKGTEVVQNIPENTEITLGDMTLYIFNGSYRNEMYDKKQKVPENDNSLVTLVTAYGRSALLTADIGDNNEALSLKVANQALDILYPNREDSSEEILPQILEPGEQKVVLPAGEDLNENIDISDSPDTSDPEPAPNLDEEAITYSDETVTNAGTVEPVTHMIDLLKVPHHGLPGNNPTSLWNLLTPAQAVLTGYMRGSEVTDTWSYDEIFATATNTAAVVSAFSEEGIATEYTKAQSGWSTIDGKKYYFDENGRSPQLTRNANGTVPLFGTVKVGSTPYLFSKRGYTLTGWQHIGEDYYYGDSNGVLQTEKWIGKYYVNKNGLWIRNATAAKWMKDKKGWWYRNPDGTYPRNSWKKLGNKWYYFDSSGYMKTGWFKVSNKWYYCNSSGHMQTGWIRLSGKYYYLESSGAMRTGWMSRYYFNSSGVMQTGWAKINNIWYYFNSSGYMQTGWIQLSGKWYYLNSDGTMQTGWMSRFYFNSSGVMQVGWSKINGIWYYFNNSGYMQTGWVKLGNTWYYLNRDGSMAIGWLTLGNAQYYLNSSGAMLTGTHVINGDTCVFNSSGVLIRKTSPITPTPTPLPTPTEIPEPTVTPEPTPTEVPEPTPEETPDSIDTPTPTTELEPAAEAIEESES